MSLLSYPFPKCVSPVHFTNKWSHEKMFVPCGNCWACKLNKGFKYSKLCQYESSTSKVVLLTLTYANRFIPSATVIRSIVPLQQDEYMMCDKETGEVLGHFSCPEYKLKLLLKKCHHFGRIPYLSKYQLQLFLKRLRHYLNKYENCKIRYFACGEYGPETYRPHFHLLLFIEPESEKLFEASGHTLGEFPRFTWSRRKNVVFTSETPLSKLEFYIRKSWTYGSTDFARVSHGDASTYVATYVNSSVDVPACFTLRATKPFCVHSRFLGRKIFEQEFISFCKSSPKDLVHRSVEVSGKYEDTRLPNEVATAFYPRCKGFSYSTDEQLYFRYMLYPRLIFSDLYRGKQGLRCSDLASDICVALHNFVEAGYIRTSFDDIILYFLESTDYTRRYSELLNSLDADVDITNYSKQYLIEVFNEDVRYSIYRELLVSKLFYNNALKWKDYLESHCNEFLEVDFLKLFFKKIKNFWSYVDYCNLRQWYDDQQVYFKLDYANVHDILYMYNNTDFEDEQFMRTPFYKTFVSYARDLSEQVVKHKIQNDKNKIFI